MIQLWNMTSCSGYILTHAHTHACTYTHIVLYMRWFCMCFCHIPSIGECQLLSNHVADEADWDVRHFDCKGLRQLQCWSKTWTIAHLPTYAIPMSLYQIIIPLIFWHPDRCFRLLALISALQTIYQTTESLSIHTQLYIYIYIYTSASCWRWV